MFGYLSSYCNIREEKLLANLCPATDGACVYSARSFYGSVYGTVINYPDCGGEEGSRLAYNESKNSIENKKKLNWNIKIYPNPTSSRLTLKSTNETELLYLEVKDLSNRTLLKKVVKTSAFIYTLDLDLINGAYFISIGNDKNEKIIKKLLIAK